MCSNTEAVQDNTKTAIAEWVSNVCRLNEDVKESAIDGSKLWIHEDHVKMHKNDPSLAGWVVRSEHCEDGHGRTHCYYPIHCGCNGIRFWCVYVNINKDDKLNYGKLFRLVSHNSGDVDPLVETLQDNELARPCV